MNQERGAVRQDWIILTALKLEQRRGLEEGGAEGREIPKCYARTLGTRRASHSLLRGKRPPRKAAATDSGLPVIGPRSRWP